MNTTVKTCFKCNVEKPITEFYAHSQMGDGRLNKCKECTKRDVAENYRKNVEHYAEYERARYQDPARRRASHEAAKRTRKRNPEKKAAWAATGNAIRDGRLKRMPCEVCGSEKSEAHHDDYSKPLDVRWLCRIHHLEHHGKVSYFALENYP